MNPEYPGTLRTHANAQEVENDLIFSGLGYFLPVPQEPARPYVGKRVLRPLFQHPAKPDDRDARPKDGGVPDAQRMAAPVRQPLRLKRVV